MNTEQSIRSKLTEIRIAGDKRVEVRLLRDLGAFYQGEKRWQEAEETCRNIIKLCEDIKHPAGRAQALAWIAKTREMAGDTSGAREFGEQAIVALEGLSIQEWIEAIQQPDSLITLDSQERYVSPEEALRLHILNARGWVSGLQLRAASRFYKDFFLAIGFGVLAGAGLGSLGGLAIAFFVKSVLPCVVGGAVVGALVLGFVAFFNALHTLGMQLHSTDRDS